MTLQSDLHFSPDGNISTITGCNVMQRCTNIHGSLRIGHNDPNLFSCSTIRFAFFDFEGNTSTIGLITIKFYTFMFQYFGS